MRGFAFAALVVLTVTCGPSPDAKLPGMADSNGGSVAPSKGGTTETGGASANGGAVSSGGTTVVASGGKTGSGGAVSSGGTKVTGGASGSAGGSVSTGGAVASGGAVGNGGAASGGVTGAGGSTAIDASPPPPSGDGGNCISKIINNGYACGTATACSACKENNTSLESICKAALDCFETKYPCTGNCQTECFNAAHASGPAQACVTALQTAACTGTGGC